MEHPAAMTKEEIAVQQGGYCTDAARELADAATRKALWWANSVMMTDGDTNLEALLDEPWPTQHAPSATDPRP